MGIRVALNHNTEYHYDKPTTLGAHVVRLKPAAHCRTRIESYALKVTPDNHFINWQQDPFGNYLARLVFPEPTKILKIEVELIADLTAINPFDFFVEEYAETYPFEYSKTTEAELQPYLQCEKSDALTQWLEKNRPANDLPINDWLVAINQAMQRDIDYRVRMEPGVQSCTETLSLGSGSCRDSAWLLVEALRQCGLAARFVSGYLVQLAADEKPLNGPSGPESDFTDLHAWAEVYLPGAGWVGMDPTSGLFAGEGHIPLACTPQSVSAAAITGGASGPASDFKFSNTVTRIDEKVRITKPYTEKDWGNILQLGAQIDKRLQEQDVRLTMGGEPTFVSVDDVESAQWNTAALGAEKLEIANQLMIKMRDHFAPGGLPVFAQGKWYPGEPTPRWALSCYWRTDGAAMWHDDSRIKLPGVGEKYTRNQANQFASVLTHSLRLEPQCLHACFEDPLYHLQIESLLPTGTDLADLDLKDSRSRQNLVNRLGKGLDEPIGWMLPLRRTESGWRSSVWPLRRDKVFLVPGDSPMGLRLPLESITADDDEALLAYPEDSFDQAQVLPAPSSIEERLQDPLSAPLAHPIRSALCVEWRDDEIHVFLPPLRSAVPFVELVATIEKAATEADVSVIIEGYEPPRDSRLKSFRITPDPGVIEVNVHPVESFGELVEQTEVLYQLAKSVGLAAEKFMVDGRHAGTGGGNHITFGGPTPEDSPFIRRPELLASIITYWQHHPSLSYLFSGMFVGPTSQAPRVDEARSDTLYELEMALSRIPAGQVAQPWLADRLLRHLLIDVTGNTHRAEICIDKLYSPDGPAGRQGLVELRAFEMPPHPRMSIAQGLLLRCLISRFWDHPYRAPLKRWGTQLHDQYMLPHYLHEDITDVIEDLRSHGIKFGQHWLDAFWEFRLPIYGSRTVGDITLELRSAIEPWHVLGEEASGSGMSRYVDSSMERLQLKVSGLTDDRYQIACNQRVLALTPTGVHGEYVTGIRFRAWQPPSCLHPDLPVDVPLVFDVIDTVHQRSLGGCAYNAVHPGGRSHDDVPVNANVAESRRLARFEEDHHTPWPAAIITPVASAGSTFEVVEAGEHQAVETMPSNTDFPHTADLRFARTFL